MHFTSDVVFTFAVLDLGLSGAELVLVGRSGLILARHGQRWLRAWTPQGLETAEEFCIDSLVIQWLYESVPWQAKLKLATTEPPQLLLDCGPLPVGEAVSAQLTTNSGGLKRSLTYLALQSLEASKHEEKTGLKRGRCVHSVCT